MSGVDYYATLGVDFRSTDKEIQKAYRKKALKFHPDKNKSESAVKIFHDLSVAYELLSDPHARAAYDQVIAARKAKELRDSKLDDKRKKMKLDLEAREAAARRPKHTFSSNMSEADAEKALQKEISRLRAEGSDRLRKMQDDILVTTASTTNVFSPAHSSGEAISSAKANTKIQTNEDVKDKRVKAKWSKKTNTEYLIDESIVRKVFCHFGRLGNVVVLAHKRSALIEFESTGSARSALAADSESIKPFSCSSFSTSTAATTTNTPLAPSSHRHEPAFAQPDALAGDLNYETSVLARLRRTQEMKNAQVQGGSSFQPSAQQREMESPAARQIRQEEERKRLIAEMLDNDNNE
eukprot:CFRG0815T1